MHNFGTLTSNFNLKNRISPQKKKISQKSIQLSPPKIKVSKESTFKPHVAFHPQADEIPSEEDTDYHESSIFNTSDIEEEIIQQGVLSVVSQFNIQRSKYIIDPDSTFKMIWDVLNFIFIIYQSIIIPYRISFDVPPQGNLFYLELFMDITFMFDIILTFNFGYYRQGISVLERKEIAVNYLKSWFILDLIATFPYNYTVDILF